MGKLRVYPTYHHDFRTALISVPTSQEYLDEEVVEELTDVADQIGYEKYECESKKPERFIGTTMDVLKITFKTLADMMRFKAHVDDQYA